MLKGSISSYLDTRIEEESSYVTLSNGPYAYVATPTSPEPDKYRHTLAEVYFVTPILCLQCEDYIWGTGNVGVKCKEVLLFVGVKAPRPRVPESFAEEVKTGASRCRLWCARAWIPKGHDHSRVEPISSEAIGERDESETEACPLVCALVLLAEHELWLLTEPRRGPAGQL